LPLPPALVGKPLVAADFAEGAKFGNYLGGLVNRIGGRATRGQAVAAAAPAVADVTDVPATASAEPVTP
jgi:hypothetical protein